MKPTLTFFAALLLFVSCDNTTKYQPSSHLSETEQESFKYEIVRDAGRLVKRANHDTKNNPDFNLDYKQMAMVMKLDYYYPNTSDGYTYFQIRRVAPSIHEKYVATGGRFKRNNEGKISEYEEIYRTWKMSEEELAKKTMFFENMVKGKDLSPYYTANIGDTEHIEFPDHQTYYNKEARRWEMRGTTPVQ